MRGLKPTTGHEFVDGNFVDFEFWHQLTKWSSRREELNFAIEQLDKYCGKYQIFKNKRKKYALFTHEPLNYVCRERVTNEILKKQSETENREKDLGGVNQNSEHEV